MPYEFIDDEQTRLTLRVCGPKSWQVVHGFRYVDQYDNMSTHTVPSGFGPTDLASVPFFLQWLVRSYGKHTNAALVHDVYWDEEANQATLHEANTVFRHAMWESDVPWLRRWFMWSAVTLAMLTRTWPGRIRVLIWSVGLVIGLAALLGSFGVVLPRPAVTWASVAILIVLVLTFLVAAFIVSIRGGGARTDEESESADTGCNGESSDVVRAIAKKVAFGAVGMFGVLWLVFSVGHNDSLIGRGAWVAAAALAVALLAWGHLMVAGLFATLELAIIAVPVVAIAAALLVYGALEGTMLLLLKFGRAVKSACGRAPVGTLNPLASARIEAPPPPPDATLSASKL